jgi:hypothetical protein
VLAFNGNDEQPFPGSYVVRIGKALFAINKNSILNRDGMQLTRANAQEGPFGWLDGRVNDVKACVGAVRGPERQTGRN